MGTVEWRLWGWGVFGVGSKSADAKERHEKGAENVLLSLQMLMVMFKSVEGEKIEERRRRRDVETTFAHLKPRAQSSVPRGQLTNNSPFPHE